MCQDPKGEGCRGWGSKRRGVLIPCIGNCLFLNHGKLFIKVKNKQTLIVYMVIAKTLWAKAVGYGVQGIGSPLSLGRKIFRFLNPSRRDFRPLFNAFVII